MNSIKRLTRPLDEYPCRIKDCFAEEWMRDHYGEYPPENHCVCDGCPFETIVNHLAEYEDKENERPEQTI